MSHVTWYLSRSAGLVAWFLLLASAVIGAALPAGWFTRWPRSVRDGLHRWVSSLAVAATLTHLVPLLFDRYVSFTLREMLVPYASGWKPGPVAAGVVAFWLLVLVTVTSVLRRRINIRLWRSVHLGSYALCLFASLHAATAGTDVAATGFPYLIGSCVAALVALVALLRAWSPTPAETRAARRAASE